MKTVDPNNLTHTERSMIVAMRAVGMPVADIGGKWSRAGLVDERGKLTPAGERLADKVAVEEGCKITWEVRTD